ncbi:hypothetical protein QC761_604784 [Podospora bellae-mahoneyi]|uniref:Phosphatidic acid phosphatase type 2/haloperoxidase domain-containing protein n=1 Tax=Podospora bellae-mahoneyi TaxID=2093777 RepID=A0ABR0F880_9PEZI|nr:hypothetical protein QC761_604784 [Podospora bellae-mahoneyi]
MKGKLSPWRHCPRAPFHSDIPITFSSCRAECINLDPRCTTTAQVSSRHRMSLISQRVLDALGLISSMPLMLVGLKFASKLQRGADTARLLLVMSIILANMWHLRWRHQQRLRNGATHPHHGRCVIRTREGTFLPVDRQEQNRSLIKLEPSISALITDWSTMFAGELSAFVIVNFHPSTGWYIKALHDCLSTNNLTGQALGSSPYHEWLTQSVVSGYLPPNLQHPSSQACIFAVLVYSFTKVYHLVQKPRCWADFGLIAIICSVLTGVWLGKHAMADALVLGAFLSLLCAKLLELVTVRRHSETTVDYDEEEKVLD